MGIEKGQSRVFSEGMSSFCRDKREAGCAALLLIWNVFAKNRVLAHPVRLKT